MTAAKRSPVRYAGASRKVLEYLQEHDGRNVTLERMASDLGFPVHVAGNAAQHLRSTGRYPVTNEGKGVYRYTSAPATRTRTTSGIYEEVGQFKDGRIIVRGEDGQLFALTEL